MFFAALFLPNQPSCRRQTKNAETTSFSVFCLFRLCIGRGVPHKGEKAGPARSRVQTGRQRSTTRSSGAVTAAPTRQPSSASTRPWMPTIPTTKTKGLAAPISATRPWT